MFVLLCVSGLQSFGVFGVLVFLVVSDFDFGLPYLTGRFIWLETCLCAFVVGLV